MKNPNNKIEENPPINIIITVEGGNVLSVDTNELSRNFNVVVLDWDNFANGDKWSETQLDCINQLNDPNNQLTQIY